MNTPNHNTDNTKAPKIKKDNPLVIYTPKSYSVWASTYLIPRPGSLEFYENQKKEGINNLDFKVE